MKKYKMNFEFYDGTTLKCEIKCKCIDNASTHAKAMELYIKNFIDCLIEKETKE